MAVKCIDLKGLQMKAIGWACGLICSYEVRLSGNMSGLKSA